MSPNTDLEFYDIANAVFLLTIMCGLALWIKIMFMPHQRQIIIGLVLIMLMFLTRGQHFATLNSLPSASWAIFFLAGFYLSSKVFFPALLVFAGLLDYLAITIGGVSSYCVSPAYSLLIPAYGSLWLAGRWYRQKHEFNVQTLLPLLIAVTVSIAICTVISSGGFYFLSGRYVETSLIEFGLRFVHYFPTYLANSGLYISIALFSHILISVFNKTAIESENTST